MSNKNVRVNDEVAKMPVSDIEETPITTETIVAEPIIEEKPKAKAAAKKSTATKKPATKEDTADKKAVSDKPVKETKKKTSEPKAETAKSATKKVAASKKATEKKENVTTTKAAAKPKAEPKPKVKVESTETTPKTTKKAVETKANVEKKGAPIKTILFATSEAHPFARTGGLGDVSAALPKALNDINVDARVIMPLYHDIPWELRSTFRYVGYVYVTLAWRYQYCGLFSCNYDGVTYYFIDNEQYFKRNGLYGHFDDAERFAFFSKAVLECLRLIDFYPDVIHCNDWQTAMTPVFLDSFYRGYKEYQSIKTVFTIHNIEFQGKYGKQLIRDILGLPEECTEWAIYQDDTNFMKGAIERANVVTTVSPTYSREIMDRYFAYGMDIILNQRGFKLSGIINGIDTELFNPKTDKALFKNYDYDTIELKKENKRGLMNMLGLEYNENRPLIGMVTRLTEQKGLDLVLTVINEICQADCQLVILGTGDWKYESKLKEFEESYNDKLRVIVTFSTDIANKIYAGADMFLMPSKFEPCGLSQMIAMRYGTVPIVRETGGLKDTVSPFNPADLSGRGFTFYSYNAYDMLDAIYRAIGTYYNKREWNAIIAEDMNADFSWRKSAEDYLKLYQTL